MPPRSRRSLGPVVIGLAAGSVVLLSGMLVNGCRINKLLSSPGTGTGGGGIIMVVPSLVRDSAIAGTTALRTRDIAVSNGGSWVATTDEPWIHVSPTSGGSRATVRLTLDPQDLDPGLHRGSVILHELDDVDARATISVSFLIQQPVLAVAPKEFNFRARTSNSVFRDTIHISNEGDGPLVWTANRERRVGWLSFESDTTGTAPGALAIRVSNEGLPYFGTFRETIIVTSPGAKNSPRRIEVSIRRQRGDDDDSATP